MYYNPFLLCTVFVGVGKSLKEKSLKRKCGVYFFVFTFIVLFFTSLSWGTTYYVSNSGNDFCSGTAQTIGTSGICAWKTISKINNSKFNPGDSVLLNRGGVWREQLTVPSSGTSGYPITFGAYGTGNNPIITGSDLTGVVARDYCIFSKDKSHITIDGIDCKKVNSIGIAVFTSIANSTNHTIKNCTISGAWKGGIWFKGNATYKINYVKISNNTLFNIGGSTDSYYNGSGIYLDHSDYFEINNNHFTYSNPPSYNNYVAGIQVVHMGGTNTNSSIHHNIIDGINTVANQAVGIALGNVWYLDVYANDISGDYTRGIWTDETNVGLGDGSYYSNYHHNYFHMTTSTNQQTGFNLETTYRDNVYYNIFNMPNAAWGMWLGIDGSKGRSGTTIYNNVFYVGGSGICLQAGWTQYPSYLHDLTVKNNIFYKYGANGALVTVQKEEGADNGHIFNNNLYYDAGTASYHIGWFGVFSGSLAVFKTKEMTQESAGIELNPLFKPDSFDIASNSPAINKGAYVSLTSDYPGNPIVGAPDIGAYEYGSSPVPPPPIPPEPLPEPLPAYYSLGGTVSGLNGTLILQNNGKDDKYISANGSFIFPTSIISGTSYYVTVYKNPTNQICNITNARGTVLSTNVTNINVTCTKKYRRH